MSQQGEYVGKEVLYKLGVLDVSYSFENGLVKNWDNMTKVWSETFYELGTFPKDHPAVLLTEPMGNPKGNREQMTQLMFEHHRAPAVYISTPAVLSLYSQSLTTGVSLDSGDAFTYVVPINDGDVLPNGIRKVDVAGRDLTDYFMKILMDRKCSQNIEMEFCKELKEKLSYTTLNYEQEMKKAAESADLEKSYKLPNGETITVKEERFRCPESLFCPTLLDKKGVGIHEAIQNCISTCDEDLHKDLYSNIVLSGGSTMFKGIVNRLQRELTDLAPSNATNVKVIAPPKRRDSVWIGGSILASLSTFKEMWISKQEYEEFGPRIVHTKCRSYNTSSVPIVGKNACGCL